MKDAGKASTLRFSDCGFFEETFAKNVRALAARNPELARTLEAGGIHEGLFLALDEQKTPRVCKRMRRHFARIEETGPELARPAFEFRRDTRSDTRLWIGLGTGERVHHAIESSPPTRTHFVHETDPGLLYLALSRRDWRDAIGAGRVIFLLGSDFTSIPLEEIGTVVRHPLLAAFGDDAWNAAVRSESPEVREKRPRALVIEGELLELELARAFDELGYETWRLPVSALSQPEIRREVRGFAPDVTAGINFIPEFAAIAAAEGVPYIAWEIDPVASTIPFVPAADPAAANTFIFTWKRSRVAMFERLGWSNAEHLPLAADPFTRRVEETDPALANSVIFVGSCMRANARRLIELFVRGVQQDDRRRREWAGVLGDVRALESAIEKNPCVRGIEDMLRDMLSRRGLPQAISIDGAEADVVVLLGETLAATKRCALARILAHEQSFRVYGEADWKAEIPAPHYFGPIAHGRPLSRAYRSAAITVDMNRVYQADIATLRLFETIAAGGFVLAELSDDLPELFMIGDEIAAYGSVAELEEEVRYFLAHPEARTAIAARGRARLERDHTVIARLRTMLGRVLVPV